jgi:hypothetical protein
MNNGTVGKISTADKALGKETDEKGEEKGEGRKELR